MKSQTPIRVVVAEDHDIMRRNITALLNRESDLEVVGTAVNGREAVLLAEEIDPDVIVMDVFMPELDGIRAAGEIKKAESDARIIILSMHYSTALVQQARRSGVSAYILKQETTSSLVPAIRAAYQGQLSL